MKRLWLVLAIGAGTTAILATQLQSHEGLSDQFQARFVTAFRAVDRCNIDPTNACWIDAYRSIDAVRPETLAEKNAEQVLINYAIASRGNGAIHYGQALHDVYSIIDLRPGR